MDRIDAHLLNPLARVVAADPVVVPATPYGELPESVRVARTRELVRTRSTDSERWSDPRNLACGSAISRMVAAARFIPSGCRVLDLGAGTEALRACLAPDCQYAAVDLVSRGPGTIVADLNAGDFPAGRFDVVVALAVLEYIHDVGALLRRAAAAAPLAVVSYCAQHERSGNGERFGWCNAMTFVDFLDVVHGAGWTIARAEVLHGEPSFTQWLFALRPTRSGPSRP